MILPVVRGARLLREGEFDQKQWIEDRSEFLASLFAVDVAKFAVLDNHLHVLVSRRKVPGLFDHYWGLNQRTSPLNLPEWKPNNSITLCSVTEDYERFAEC